MRPCSTGGKKHRGDMMDMGTVGALSLSVASSVSIVIVNKYLISSLGRAVAIPDRTVCS